MQIKDGRGGFSAAVQIPPTERDGRAVAAGVAPRQHRATRHGTGLCSAPPVEAPALGACSAARSRQRGLCARTPSTCDAAQSPASRALRSTSVRHPEAAAAAPLDEALLLPLLQTSPLATTATGRRRRHRRGHVGAAKRLGIKVARHQEAAVAHAIKSRPSPTEQPATAMRPRAGRSPSDGS